MRWAHSCFVGLRQMLEGMNRAIEVNLRPVINRTFAFEQVRNALEYMDAARTSAKSSFVFKFLLSA
jgi:hypothetical protein